MKPDPQISIESATEKPIWLISDHTFEENRRNQVTPLLSVDENQGIALFTLDEDFDFSRLDNSGCWGIHPILKGNRKIALQRLFGHIFQHQLPILTLHIESTVNDSSQVNRALRSRFGKIINSRRIRQFTSAEELQIYVQNKLSLYAIARTTGSHSSIRIRPESSKPTHHWTAIQSELDQLYHRQKCIMERGKYQLFLTKFKGLHAIPHEIGRLRAITYAEVGEGSEKSIDLDIFDETYDQLFLVNIESQEIIGGYRIGLCDSLINEFGVAGLYTHQLYHIDPKITPILCESIELGRSFIISSYQKKHLPLFLLWNGILNYIRGFNHIKYIFGMVSISRVYSDISRSLIISYLKQYHFDWHLAEFFQPRQEYYSSSSEEKLNTLINVFNGQLIHLDEFISEIEPENYRLPVLIRKYINQNAQFIGFNIDPEFSYCVDGLMLLDVDRLPAQTIQLLNK